MNLIDTPLSLRLNQFLDATAYRSGLIADNIANIDTPGYHARDLDFQSQLTSLMGNDPQPAKPHAIEVKGLMERPDGNNVNMDRETRLLSENAIRFNVASTLLKSQIRQLRAAIQDGK